MTPAPERPLKIALVIEDANMRGGQERVIAELAGHLAARHDVHLFCYTVADIPLDGIHVHRMRDVALPLGLRALWFAVASARKIRLRDFDVVLSQGGNTLTHNFALVHTCHRDRRRVRLQVERQWHLKSPLRRFGETCRDGIFAHLEARAVRRCRGRVIAVSEDLKSYLMREYGLASPEIHVAPSGVDHDLFHPGQRDAHRARLRGELGLTDDDFVALFMGGLWFEKGVPQIIEGLSRAQSRAHLVVAGSGDSERFAAMADDCGVRDRVHFVGRVSEPEAWYGMADCLVHVPVVEPFGLVMLEAAACGLPLIATRVSIALDLIEDDLTGRFVDRDPASIATALDHLAASPDLRRAMAAEIHGRSLPFTWDRQAEEIERIFVAALTPRPPEEEPV